MPRRLVNHRFWVRNRGLFGYLILCAATLVALYIAYEAAQRGEEAHAALCANRADLNRRLSQSEAYLRMTVAERIKRFGLAFAHVPRPVIETQIVNYQRTIRSYDALRC